MGDKKAKTSRLFGGRLPGKTNHVGYITDVDGVFEKDPGGLYKWIEKSSLLGHIKSGLFRLCES